MSQLHQRFFSPQAVQQSPFLSDLQVIFERDFINEETKEKNIIPLVRRLKNLKDFVHKRISLQEPRSHLELISPFLANFNDKGVELPGQFMISESEPLPQNTVYIQMFEPQIYKGPGGLGNKRISIKCSN